MTDLSDVSVQLNIFPDTPRRPPFDPELVPVWEQYRPVLPRLSDENLSAVRQIASGGEQVDFTANGAINVEELVVPGHSGAPDLRLLVLTPTAKTEALPLMYFIHGGGMVAGNSRWTTDAFLPFVADGSMILVSPDYRLAPENPDPAPIEDCYSGLVWVANHAGELGYDPDRLMIAGISGGGGLAAGTTLLARDRGFPAVSHQMLMCPMLDDRFSTHSSRMLDGEGIWDRNDNLYGWTALLGERRGEPDVAPYAAPARETNLEGLPRTYIDVGSAEGFRDEAIDYALRLSQAGVSVDLHMFAGGFHGYEVAAPHAAISRITEVTREEFIRRAFER